MKQEELQKKAKNMQSLYKNYEAQIEDLHRKQSALIASFVQELEQAKIESIRHHPTMKG